MTEEPANPGRRGPSDFVESRQKVVVVGDGILGNMIGRALNERKSPPDVVTISTTEITDDRASDASLVWLNVISAEAEPYARLRKASMDLWAQLASDIECPVQLRGSLLWDRDRAGLEKLAALHRKVGWDTTIIGPDEFQRLAPGIFPVPDAALYAPNEGAGFPPWVMGWADTGADIDAKVDEVLAEGGAAVGVKLASGEEIRADHVVIAAGCGTAAILESVSVPLPMRDAPGMCLWTDPLPIFAKPVLASPDMDFWQDDDGMVMIATGTHDTMTSDLHATVEAAVDRLKTLVPSLDDVKVREAKIRQRPIPSDGLPALGSPEGIENLHVAVCHSGMTLAPIVARIVRAAIFGEAPPIDLAPFHIDRFRGGRDDPN